jgi:T-complex protein 1 subunit theta
VLSKLYAAHQAEQRFAGVDIEAGVPAVCDAVENKIFDLFLTKYWALKFATTAACTVLRVDQVSLSSLSIQTLQTICFLQIIMAKAAGGPKPKENKDWDED